MTPPSTPKAPKNILIFSPILLPIFIFSRNFCGKVLLLHVQQLICVCVWLCEPLLILRFGGRWICVYQAQEIVIQLHWLLTLIWIDWMQWWLVALITRKKYSASNINSPQKLIMHCVEISFHVTQILREIKVGPSKVF